MIHDRRGVAALEFALVAPVLISMFVGLPEVVRYVRMRTLFYSASAGIADMVAAQAGVTSGSTGTMADYCKAALMTVAAFPGGNLAVAVASVSNTAATVARDWEYDAACPTAATGIGRTAAATLAASMVPNAGDSVIVVQSSFTYVPAITGVITPRTFQQTTFARPLRSVVLCSVAGTSGSACPAVP